jgi:hypothetical protein
MEGYDVAQICVNGHVISSMAGSNVQYRQEHCNKCGAKTIMSCQKCNKPINGYHHVPGVIGFFDYNAPRFCEYCGEAFPWIKSKIESSKELVDLMDSLTVQEKDDLKESIEDLVRETSKVPVAKVKLKKYLAKVDSGISDGIKDILKDTLSDEIKKDILR